MKIIKIKKPCFVDEICYKFKVKIKKSPLQSKEELASKL